MFTLLLRLTTLLGCLCLGGLPLLQATDNFTALDQGISGTVDAIAPTTTGGLYVGGTFTTINVTGSTALTANNVAFWSGTAWSTLGGGVNGNVTSIAITGNIVLVGGTFTSALQNTGISLQCNNLVEWNSNLNKWFVVGGNSPGGGCNGTVTSLVFDSQLGWFWIGGTFSLVDAAPFSVLGSGNLATYNPTSLNLLPYAFAPNNTVLAMALDSSISTSSAYFGGLFTPTSTPTNSPNTGFLKTTNGALATVPDLGLTPVDALAVDASHEVYIGGNFTFPGSTASSSIAMLNSGGTAYVGLGSGLTTSSSLGTVLAILVPGSGNTNPIVGGTFDHAGSVAASNLATWDPGSSTWSSYTGTTNGAVEVLATDSFGSVYVGGAFTTAISFGSGSISSAIVRVGPSLFTTTTTTSASTTTTSGTGSGTGSSSGSTSTTSATTTTSATATSSGNTVVPSGGSSSGGCGLGSSLGVLVLMALLITYRRLR
jgi:hypothetical protein